MYRIGLMLALTIVLPQPLMAQTEQCKRALEAFNQAKDAENKACNAAVKPLWESTLEEIKNAAQHCKDHRKKSEVAHKKMLEHC